MVTPSASLRGTWLQVAKPARRSRSPSTRLSSWSRSAAAPPQALAAARAVVPTGLLASGRDAPGRSRWRPRPALGALPAPVRVSWFPALATRSCWPSRGRARARADRASRPHLLAAGRYRARRAPPAPDAGDGGQLASARRAYARLPADRGGVRARRERARSSLARAVVLAGQPARRLTTHAAVAGAGRLDAAAAAAARAARLPAARLAAERRAGRRAPPRARARRRRRAAGRAASAGATRTRPPQLAALWSAGPAEQITRGAVMMFEHDHGLAVDGIAGPHGLARAARRRASPASAHQSGLQLRLRAPQRPAARSTLWSDGHDVLTSPGNTGVPAAPTQLGTFPVFEHIPVGTMSGTNPDGSPLQRPGIRWISYFNGGDAIHAFTARLLRHAAEPRLRRAAARRGGEGLALHADRHARHDRELTAGARGRPRASPWLRRPRTPARSRPRAG